MKLLFAFIFCFITGVGFAQQFLPAQLPIDSVTNLITFKKDIYMPGLSANSIYKKMQRMMISSLANKSGNARFYKQGEIRVTGEGKFWTIFYSRKLFGPSKKYNVNCSVGYYISDSLFRMSFTNFQVNSKYFKGPLEKICEHTPLQLSSFLNLDEDTGFELAQLANSLKKYYVTTLAQIEAYSNKLNNVKQFEW